MKKLAILICVALFGANVSAQEIFEYQQIDTTFQTYQPEPYSQTPVRESIRESKNRHAKAGLDKRFHVSFGMGMAFSTFKAPVFTDYNEAPTYQKLRTMTNYYSVEASYLASERLLLTGSLIYANNHYGEPRTRYNSANDGYIATFGATYQISPSFSIGFEVSQSHNMYPVYGGYGNRYRGF
ncbi:MAG: hypothetical protein J5826_01060 [Bacteroidales bacterium]|nr:hypothetical protein [Bacteroidales bacterium]